MQVYSLNVMLTLAVINFFMTSGTLYKIVDIFFCLTTLILLHYLSEFKNSSYNDSWSIEYVPCHYERKHLLRDLESGNVITYRYVCIIKYSRRDMVWILVFNLINNVYLTIDLHTRTNKQEYE